MFQSFLDAGMPVERLVMRLFDDEGNDVLVRGEGNAPLLPVDAVVEDEALAVVCPKVWVTTVGFFDLL